MNFIYFFFKLQAQPPGTIFHYLITTVRNFFIFWRFIHFFQVGSTTEIISFWWYTKGWKILKCTEAKYWFWKKSIYICINKPDKFDKISGKESFFCHFYLIKTIKLVYLLIWRIMQYTWLHTCLWDNSKATTYNYNLIDLFYKSTS